MWDEVLTAYPDYRNAVTGKVEAYMAMGRWNDASKDMDAVINAYPVSHNTLNQRGFIAFKQGNHDEAISYFAKALKIRPLNRDSMIYLGTLYLTMGNYEKSRFFLNRADSRHPNVPIITLLQLENAAKSNNDALKQEYLRKIFNLLNQKEIFNHLFRSKKHDAIPLALDVLVPLIVSAGKQKSESWIGEAEPE